MFTEVYWRSKSPAVRELREMPSCSPERLAKAFQLAQDGHILDYEIDAVGLDPYQTMWLRQTYGLTWTQKFPDPPNWSLPPGVTGMPGIPFDPDNPPPGAIKTSTNEEDYPAFDPDPAPMPLPDSPAEPWWNRPLGAGKYGVRPRDNSPSGTVSGLYVKRIIYGPFGAWAWWEVVQ